MRGRMVVVMDNGSCIATDWVDLTEDDLEAALPSKKEFAELLGSDGNGGQLNMDTGHGWMVAPLDKVTSIQFQTEGDPT